MTLFIWYSLSPHPLPNAQKKKGEGRRIGGSTQTNEPLHLKKTAVTGVTNHIYLQTTRRIHLPSAAVGLIKICSAVSFFFFFQIFVLFQNFCNEHVVPVRGWFLQWNLHSHFHPQCLKLLVKTYNYLPESNLPLILAETVLQRLIIQSAENE